MNKVDPVIMTFDVPLSPAEAFDLFTSELDTWWPFIGHSCTDDEHAKVHFDQRVGGQVLERSADESRSFVWGTIIEWDAPTRFSMSWHPGQPADQATKLAVSFAKSAEGCTVTLIHDGWEARGEKGLEMRGMYAQGWVAVTQSYTARAKESV
jgi:hypothetical protein